MTQAPITYSASCYISFAELSVSANISEPHLVELVEHNIIAPLEGSQPQYWQFHVACVTQVQKALRLNHDLDMSWPDLALVLHLLDEIAELQHKNNELHQQLNRFYAKS